MPNCSSALCKGERGRFSDGATKGFVKFEKSNEHRPQHKRNRGQKEQGVHYYEEQSTGVHDQRFFEQSRFNSAVRELVKGCDESAYQKHNGVLPCLNKTLAASRRGQLSKFLATYKVKDTNGQSLAYVYGRETRPDADTAHV